MARIDMVVEGAKVIADDPRDSLTPALDAAEQNKPADELAGLTSWVLSRCALWRDHRRENYEVAWDQYERLWRGMWTTEDRNRKSERSTLITPGLAEAVENIVAEVEEAIWGRGDSFDLSAEFDSEEEAKLEVDKNKARLKEDLGRGGFTSNVGEALINAAVYGSGIGEIIVETFKLRKISASVTQAFPPAGAGAPEMGMNGPGMGLPEASSLGMAAPQLNLAAFMQPNAPAPVPAPYASPEMAAQSVSAKAVTTEVQYACLQSVNPRNFLIDPTARTIDKALGVAIEEYVGAHSIRKGQKSGDYRKVEVGTSAGEYEIIPDKQAQSEYVFDKVHVIRYYGLVPQHLLFPTATTVDLSEESLAEDDAAPKEEYVDILNEGGTPSEEPIDSDMVEAVVIIANKGVCLKAIETPYLMEDRPVVAFPWDVVPGRFWGRGVCEKGEVPQRVMDAELRARIDALAYVSAPMMGMDASRLPRGFKLTVRPGKSILTNGDPNTVLRPMHFGQLEQATFAHSQQLDQMIQRATGSLDVISLASKAGGSGGDQRSGATSMMLSGIVKRHKRTLMNFIDRFYMPALQKILWRNMQYAPDRYTPRNWDFVMKGTMGIIQREYETMNLVQLLNTMEPQSPEYKMILMGVIENTGLTDRTELKAMLKQSIVMAQQAAQMQQQAQADPMQQQLQQASLQLQIAETRAKTRELESRSNLQDAKARNEMLEPIFKRIELGTKGIYAAGDQQQQVFENRMRIIDARVRDKDIDSNERIAAMQSRASAASQAVKGRAELAKEALKARAGVAQEAIKGRATVAAARAKPMSSIQARGARVVA